MNNNEAVQFNRIHHQLSPNRLEYQGMTDLLWLIRGKFEPPFQRAEKVGLILWTSFIRIVATSWRLSTQMILKQRQLYKVFISKMMELSKQFQIIVTVEFLMDTDFLKIYSLMKIQKTVRPSFSVRENHNGLHVAWIRLLGRTEGATRVTFFARLSHYNPFITINYFLWEVVEYLCTNF